MVLGEQHQYPTLRGFVLWREHGRAANALDFARVERMMREAHAEAERTGDYQRVVGSLHNLSAAIGLQGRLDDAVVAGTEHLVAARRLHMPFGEQVALLRLAGCALLRGALDRVAAYLAQIPGAIVPESLLRTSLAEMTSGPDASLLLDPADSLVEATQRPLVHGDHARVLFNLGDHVAARAALTSWRETLPPPSALGWWRMRALGLVDECLPALGETVLVEEQYQEAVTWTPVRVASDYAARGMDHILGALALRLERLDEASRHYRTGLAWAERERCPVEQGRCLEGLAEVAIRRGRKDEAREDWDGAAALFEQHGAVFYRRRLQARRAELTA